MEEIELMKKMGRALVETFSDTQRLNVLLDACESGNVYEAIHKSLEPVKKQRKKRAKKVNPGILNPEKDESEQPSFPKKRKRKALGNNPANMGESSMSVSSPGNGGKKG